MQTPCGERTVGTGPFSSCLCPVTDFQKGRRGQLEPETGEAGVLEPSGEVLDFILSAVGDNEEVKAGNHRITFVAQKE